MSFVQALALVSLGFIAGIVFTWRLGIWLLNDEERAFNFLRGVIRNVKAPLQNKLCLELQDLLSKASKEEATPNQEPPH